MKCYYIGYYNCDEIRHEMRIVSPASENKMNYIIYALKESNIDYFEVVSLAETKLNKFVKGNKIVTKKNFRLKTFCSFSSSVKIFRGIGHIITKLDALFYLLRNINKNDCLIVYHSMLLMNLTKIIKRIKRCKLTIEVEELYSDVYETINTRKKEIEYLQIADNYILVTNQLNQEINSVKKYIVVHGTYQSLPNYNFSFNDNKIHIVYAGTFMKNKGVDLAISVASFLNSDYVIDILGNGSEKEQNEVLNKINLISKNTSCIINYVGLKTGEDFNAYIQACSIGISPQKMDAKFNGSSFPSKILMYMSNGLRVISAKIPVIEKSSIGDFLFYYDKEDPKVVADVIKSIDLNDKYNGKQILDSLHFEFVNQLNSLLGQ